MQAPALRARQRSVGASQPESTRLLESARPANPGTAAARTGTTCATAITGTTTIRKISPATSPLRNYRILPPHGPVTARRASTDSERKPIRKSMLTSGSRILAWHLGPTGLAADTRRSFHNQAPACPGRRVQVALFNRRPDVDASAWVRFAYVWAMVSPALAVCFRLRWQLVPPAPEERSAHRLP